MPGRSSCWIRHRGRSTTEAATVQPSALRADGRPVNRKRIRRLMRQMGIAALGPQARRSRRRRMAARHTPESRVGSPFTIASARIKRLATRRQRLRRLCLPRSGAGGAGSPNLPSIGIWLIPSIRWNQLYGGTSFGPLSSFLVREEKITLTVDPPPSRGHRHRSPVAADRRLIAQSRAARRRIDNTPPVRSTSPRRSGALILRSLG
jgi:HTH-like domain